MTRFASLASILAFVVSTSAFSPVVPHNAVCKTLGNPKVALGIKLNFLDEGVGENERNALWTVAGMTPVLAVLFSSLPADETAGRVQSTNGRLGNRRSLRATGSNTSIRMPSAAPQGR